MLRPVVHVQAAGGDRADRFHLLHDEIRRLMAAIDTVLSAQEAE